MVIVTEKAVPFDYIPETILRGFYRMLSNSRGLQNSPISSTKQELVAAARGSDR